MDFLGSNSIDIESIYARYCQIILRNEHGSIKEELAKLSMLVNSRGGTSGRSVIFDDLSKLMSLLNLTVDSQLFAHLYDFVFFVCCENGQKGMSVKRAVTAWRFVLTGRFRLLNQWCEFVEKHQRHNISKDTWQQLLAFSRCLHEDLDGYDPKGAWPILSDEFVEHMYRIAQSNQWSSQNLSYSCGDIETQPCMSSSFAGLVPFPGSKRKYLRAIDNNDTQNAHNSVTLETSSTCKRSRKTAGADKLAHWETNSADDHVGINKHNQLGCSNSFSCAIEGSLWKGFERLLSTGHHLHFDQGRRVSLI